MRHARQVKEAPEQEVVVQEAVAFRFSTDYGFERYLKIRKPQLQKLNKVLAHANAEAVDAADALPDGQKLFLHKSVSRRKPNKTLLAQWMRKLKAEHKLILDSTGCVITLIQPNTKRPGRTFKNPDKPPGNYPYNDGMGYNAIVLLHHGKLPEREHDEASHLCGHARCVNPDHLVWEPIGINASRNECHHYSVPCSHVPPCIAHYPRHAQEVRDALEKRRKSKHKRTKYFCKNKEGSDGFSS